MRRHLSILCALAVSLGTLACSTIFGSDGDRHRYESAHARWVASGISDYDLVLTNQCFCGYAGMAVRLEVRNGNVVSRTFVASGDPVPPGAASSFRDVDGLFGVLADALGRHAARLDASYSATYGYPTKVYIDYVANAADEEYGFTVDSFTRR